MTKYVPKHVTFVVLPSREFSVVIIAIYERTVITFDTAFDILFRRYGNGDSVGILTPYFEGDEKFVSCIVYFLEDVGWMKRQPSGQYVITDKGKNEGQLS